MRPLAPIEPTPPSSSSSPDEPRAQPEVYRPENNDTWRWDGGDGDDGVGDDGDDDKYDGSVGATESSVAECEAIGPSAEDDGTSYWSATGACDFARSFRKDRCRRIKERCSVREASDGSFESPRSFIALDELPALPPWRGTKGGGGGGR